MELVVDKGQCCGCRVCELVCPKKAIEMKKDEQGFLYPYIDKEKCVDCGLCLKKCAFQSGHAQRKELNPSSGYAVRHKDFEVISKSRSGGAFTAISDVILSMDGCVYGAGFEKNNNYLVAHKKALTIEQRNELRGSKYIQSDLGTVFEEIKQDLKEGKQVLFTGVGCQVGALYKYLGKEYENLLTVDILCHGVASPRLWADFIQMRETELDGKVTKADFRDKKKYGWKGSGESLWINKKKYSTRLFSKIYNKNIADRPSCYQCKYANKERVGDITIGDFWGIEKAVPEFGTDNKGVSLVLINTTKGQELWKRVSESVEYVETTGYPYRHTAMKFPTKRPEEYEEFWKDYVEKDFAFVMKKYFEYEAKLPDKKELLKRNLREIKRKAGRLYRKVKSKIKVIIRQQ